MRGGHPIVFIAADPHGQVYRDLLELAFNRCDEFILVVRNTNGLSKRAQILLKKLAPFLKEKKIQYEWPGTRLLGDEPATVYYFKADQSARRIISSYSYSLHGWTQPYLPEDLSFLKQHEPWLINRAHAKESYFMTEDEEEIAQIITIKGLQVES